MRLAFVSLLAIALAGCSALSGGRRRDKPPVPPMQETPPPAPTDAYMDEVRRAAAAQLECPIEQIDVICLRRDAGGDCVYVRASGCERTYEYQFGDT